MADVSLAHPLIYRKRILPALVVSLAVLGLSAWPRPRIDVYVFQHSDLFVHAFMFFAMSLAWLRVRIHWSSLLSPIASLAILLEYMQIYVPGRCYSPADIIANLLGACLAVLVFSLCRKFLS